MPFLPYREPELFSSIGELVQPLKKRKIRSVLLVTDAFLKNSGATEELENTLHMAGIRCAVYDQVRPNSTVKNVEAALKMYHTQSCQCLIAFGGGCVNDVVIHLATSNMGFGGVGESGMGSYHGKTGFDAFSHTKSILEKKTWMDLPMRYQPYNRGLYGKLLHWFLR